MQSVNKKRFFEDNQHHRSNVLIYGTELEKLHPRQVEQVSASRLLQELQGKPAEYWTEYRRQFEESQKRQMQAMGSPPSGVPPKDAYALHKEF